MMRIEKGMREREREEYCWRCSISEEMGKEKLEFITQDITSIGDGLVPESKFSDC